jgi:hypothetical protein
MNVQEQKEISAEVLMALKCIDCDAIIAGGAPRNWYFGELARDIDCYLRWHVNTTGDATHTLSKLLGTPVFAEQAVDCTYSFGSDTFHLHKIISFKYKGVLFQLIIVKEDKPISNFEHAIVNHMDIGINMISCDWYGLKCLDLNTSKAFLIDVTNKTLTLYQNVMNKEQLHHCMTVHLPKMMSYYPDYKLEISGVSK